MGSDLIVAIKNSETPIVMLRELPLAAIYGVWL